MSQVKGDRRPLRGGLARIRSVYPSLAPAEQKVADFCLTHSDRVIYLSVTQLGEACDVGESTVIRFCQSAGFAGYQALKLNLASESVDTRGKADGNVAPQDPLDILVEKVTRTNLRAIDETVRILDFEALRCAIDAITRANRVEFYGVGASGFTALDAKYKFLRLGLECDAYGDPHMAAMSAARLGEGDVAVGVSHSGSTKDTVASLQVAAKNGATVVCITDYYRAPITRVADITLLTSSVESPLEGGALRSKIAQLHVLDLLHTGVVTRLGAAAQESIERTARAVVEKLY